MIKKQQGILIIATAIILVLLPALGLNLALADGSISILPSAQNDSAAEAKIQQIRQQIANLTQQLAEQKSTRSLTDAELAAIQNQINAIRIKKDLIAVQVAQIVSQRLVQAPAQTINYQTVSQSLETIQKAALAIAQEMQISGFAPAAIATIAPSGGNTTEDQIVAIQQKIAKITQEMQALKQSEMARSQGAETQTETATPSAVSVQCDATTGTCGIVGGQSATTESAVAITKEQPQKGVWQSIVDFIRNLFTF